MSNKAKSLILKLKLCKELLDGKQMKIVCNQLVTYGLTSAKLYDGTNSHSAYNILYLLWNNFQAFDLSGLINMQGKGNKKKPNLKREEVEKRRNKELEKLIKKISKDELADLFRISIPILNYYKKQKANEKVKIIKNTKKVLGILTKTLCLIIGISYSTFFKYSKETKVIDKRYRNDGKIIKKRIKQIYLKSNKHLKF